MPSTDAFALKNSDFNAFLYSGVGTELNGSDLTVLSVLARLGMDPWAEAARWTQLPRAAAIECLTRSIAAMPMDPRALAAISATATRLIQLLPVKSRVTGSAVSSVTATATAIPNWMPIAFFGLVVLMGVAFSLSSPKVAPANPVAPEASWDAPLGNTPIGEAPSGEAPLVSLATVPAAPSVAPAAPAPATPLH